MNIFYLHENPEVCAKMHCDKHVAKMIIEYAQMLSTAHRMLDGVAVKKPSKSGKTMVTHWDLFEVNSTLIDEIKAVYSGYPWKFNLTFKSEEILK